MDSFCASGVEVYVGKSTGFYTFLFSCAFFIIIIIYLFFGGGGDYKCNIILSTFFAITPESWMCQVIILCYRIYFSFFVWGGIFVPPKVHSSFIKREVFTNLI